MIKYGILEGLPVCWTDHEAWALHADHQWHPINSADVLTKARILSEDGFQRRFGPLPALPSPSARRQSSP